MIEQIIRPVFQNSFVNPIICILKDIISPNAITVLSGVLGVLALAALLVNQKVIAISLILLSGYMDILDGSLARATGKISDFGTVLDIMMDRMVEVCIIIGIWALNPLMNGLGCVLMLASILLCVTSFLVVGIFSQNDSLKSFYYSPGLIERAEAFIFFILMIIFQPQFQLLSVVFSCLVILTTVIRVYQFYQQNMLNSIKASC